MSRSKTHTLSDDLQEPAEISALADARTIHLFTGAPQGMVWAQLERSFAEIGADVTLHQVRPNLGKRAIRCHLERGDVVVCDIRHIPHSATHNIRRLASSTGATFVSVRGNSGAAQLAERLLTDRML
jgi:hypothetical protein